jgi:hypothetical protein
VKTIPITQFLRPNGEQRDITCDVEDDEAAKFFQAQALGLRFTVEILSTREVSMCLEYPSIADYDCEICGNGPEVIGKRRELLMRFDPEMFSIWKSQREGAFWKANE